MSNAPEITVSDYIVTIAFCGLCGAAAVLLWACFMVAAT